VSRTYRNKSTVPHGWEVRDDGMVYCNSCCPTKKAHREKNHWFSGRGVSRHDLEHCDCWKGPPMFRTKWARKERKDYRKTHWRSYRAKVKSAMCRAEQFGYEDEDGWEDLPRFRRTSGWLTW
jgi:hypothetical protein